MTEAPSIDRRRTPRHEAFIPLEIGSARKTRIGVTRNASVEGLLVASHGSFEVGERVQLRFRLRRDRPYHRVRGMVVRHRRVDADGPFPHMVGVRLLEPVLALGGPPARAGRPA